MPEQYDILGGKVHVYKTPEQQPLAMLQLFRLVSNRDGRHKGRQPLQSEKQIAEDWYLQLRGHPNSATEKSKQTKTFREASEQYLREYDIITQGSGTKTTSEDQHWRSDGHLIPFFGHHGLLGSHRPQGPRARQNSAPRKTSGGEARETARPTTPCIRKS